MKYHLVIVDSVAQGRNSTCSGLLVLQSGTLLPMFGHDASLAEQRGIRGTGDELRKGSRLT